MNRLRRPSPPATPRRATRAVVAALALAAAGAAYAPGPAAAQPADDDAARAQVLFQKGRKEYEAGDLGAAYVDFLEAWRLHKASDTAGNLASVEIATARFRDAADHLGYALKYLSLSGTQGKQREYLQDLLKQARAHVGTITVRLSVEAATITVDGRPAERSPLDGTVHVEPGDHVLVATAPDCDPAQQSLHTGQGTAHLLTFSLVKRGPGPGTGPGPGPGPGPKPGGPPSKRLDAVSIAGFVVAGAAAGAGVGLAIFSQTQADAAGAKLASIEMATKNNPNACAGPAPSVDCTALHDDRKARDATANAALWTFVGAGVVAAGALVYTFAIPHHPLGRAGGVTAVPVASPAGGGLLLTGSF